MLLIDSRYTPDMGGELTKAFNVLNCNLRICK